MKSEERHKLQQNVLADWIAKTIAAAKPHANVILISVLVVVVGMAGYFSYSKMASASTEQAWDEFNAALGTNEVGKFVDVTTGFPRTEAAYAASLVAADIQLTEGCDHLFTNKAIGNSELAKAVENYETVLASSHIDSLCERATFGLARAREARGELDQASQLYETVKSKWADGAYAVAAAGRAEALKQPAVKAFYDRFAKFNPRPAFSGDPGAKPAFEMKDVPSEGAPASSGDIKFEGAKGASSEGKPAADAVPPASDKPAEEKPADAKPATEPAK